MPAALFRLIVLIGLLGAPSVGWSFLGLFEEDPPVEVEKVLVYHLNLDDRTRTNDPMIRFERRRRLRGAVTSDDYKALAGKYFTVLWETEKEQRNPGMLMRLEYLGSTTGDQVHIKEVTVDKVRADNTTEIAVVGEEFEDLGDILAWKVSLLRDGTAVATAQSYMWE